MNSWVPAPQVDVCSHRERRSLESAIRMIFVTRRLETAVAWVEGAPCYGRERPGAARKSEYQVSMGSIYTSAFQYECFVRHVPDAKTQK